MISPEWQTLKRKRGANLPHWRCQNAVYHVSFRLADSLPREIREKWVEEKRLLSNFAATGKGELGKDEHDRLERLFSGRIEDLLDKGYGECLLENPDISSIVKNALLFFNGTRYVLHAWCIMPNHVHAITEPLAGWELSKIVHSWKSYTASRINRFLNRKGQLWQHEPYDHIIRSETEYRELIEYIWNNPDNAGLRHCPRWRIDQDMGMSYKPPA